MLMSCSLGRNLLCRAARERLSPLSVGSLSSLPAIVEGLIARFEDWGCRLSKNSFW